MAPLTDDPARLLAVDRAFDDVLDLDVAAREARLQALAAVDARLAADVRELLHQAEHPDARLEPAQLGRHAWQAADEALRSASATPLDTIEGYRLLSRIGRGGMATVWLAERTDRPFVQRVALKVVEATGDPDAAQRFARERDILATLDHPSIARLLDAGVAQGDRAWIAMEFIRGEPIDVSCDRRRLPVAARVALVEQAARAVAHAHAHLVVHRDLKPSNLLVTSDGRVKLLDFGIARLLDEGTQGAAGSGSTPTLAVALTPEYASPEQLRGGPVTTASDVYQLGVLLYELLTGHRPHGATRGSLAEVVRRVCDDDPVAPSTAAIASASDHATRLQIAARRRTSPRALADALRGDLDHIVLRALNREPSRRYASADALADDLERYRLGLPVNARRGTALYRARKFAGRHRTGVAAAAVAVTVLAGYAVLSTIQAQRLAQQVERTERVKAFLASLFVVSNPGVSRGEQLTARELLDRGSQRIDAELRDDPDSRAELLSTLGSVYATLGLFDRAAPLLRTALDLMDAAAGPAGQRVETGLMLGRALHYAGRFDEGERHLRDAVQLARTALDSRSELATEAARDLGSLLQTRGALDEAEQLLEEVVAIRASFASTVGDSLATPLRNLADVLVDRGDLDRAEALYRRSSDEARRRLGPDDPILAMSEDSLGRLLVRRGRHDDAERVLVANLARRKALYRETHPAVAMSLHHLGELRVAQGRMDEAEPLLRDALAMYISLIGAHHFVVSSVEVALARVALARGLVHEARRLTSQAVERITSAGLATHPALADALLAHGDVLERLGLGPEAARARARAADIQALNQRRRSRL